MRRLLQFPKGWSSSVVRDQTLLVLSLAPTFLSYNYFKIALKKNLLFSFITVLEIFFKLQIENTKDHYL
ncbi:hypothetical protein ACRRTK_018304 [Alexandromys fortis]